MNNEPESFEYDDSEAVAYIRKKLSPALKERLSDDDIVYFVDLIYEYYESRGIIEEFEDESDDSVVDIDLSEIVEYIIKNAKKDQIGSFTEEEVLSIVEAEMDFCGFEEEQEEAYRWAKINSLSLQI